MNLELTLLLAGILAGTINFFINYLELPLNKSQEAMLNNYDDWPKPKYLWLAVFGYLIIGIAGAFLTPLLNEILTLKGYGSSPYPNKLVVFGYGLVFGYSTNQLLVGIFSGILKRLAKLENSINLTQTPSSLVYLDEPFDSEPVDPFPNPEIAPTTIGGNVNSGRYGCSRKKPDGSPLFHNGIDLRAEIGTEIRAIYGGKVVRIMKGNKHLGDYIDINTKEKGFTLRYAHLSNISVFEGQIVIAGETIGKSGNSGNAINAPYPHLHLMLSKDDFATATKYADPEPYLNTKYVPKNPNNPNPKTCNT